MSVKKFLIFSETTSPLFASNNSLGNINDVSSPLRYASAKEIKCGVIN